LIRKFRVHDIGTVELSLKLFNRPTLRQFSTLTNTQEFEIDSPDIPGFIQRAWRYFGYFSPTA
jgi:hypothetical protein